MQLTKKDIIAFNQQFDKGNFENESSLDFALSHLKERVAWEKQLAYIVRSIVIDHVFQEGNKRTAAAVLMYTIELHGYTIEEKKAAGIIKNIVLNNMTGINKIRYIIEDGITKGN